MNDQGERLLQKKVIIFYFTFLIALQLLFLFIIPPFQSPDETYHFPIMAIYALGEEESEAVERATIEIMNRHNWWRLIGMGKPGNLPSRLAVIPFLGGYDARAAAKDPLFRLFHLGVGKLLGLTKETRIEALYRMAQAVSIFLLTVSFCLIYLTFEKISLLTQERILWGFWLLAFLPQLLLFGPAATPETFNLFLGCLFFYCAFSLILNQANILHPITLIFAAALSLLVDRSVFALIALTPFIFILMVRRKNLKSYFIYTFMMVFFFFAAFFFYRHYYSAQLHYFMAFFKENILVLRTNLVGLFSQDPFTRDFFLLLIDSLLLKFGWMAFGPEKWIYVLWRLILAIGFAGFFIYLIKNFINYSVSIIKKANHRKMAEREKGSFLLKMGLFALVGILVLIGGIWAFSGAHKGYIQGRQIFPLIMPIGFILAAGLATLVELAGEKMVCLTLGTLILAEFIFLSFCVWSYIIPIFHLTLKSPHPGL